MSDLVVGKLDLAFVHNCLDCKWPGSFDWRTEACSLPEGYWSEEEAGNLGPGTVLQSSFEDTLVLNSRRTEVLVQAGMD